MRGIGSAGSRGAIRRSVTVLESLTGAETIGYDDRGNRKARVMIGDTALTVVIHEAAEVVVTIWAE